jgi:hypothetical protein
VPLQAAVPLNNYSGRAAASGRAAEKLAAVPLQAAMPLKNSCKRMNNNWPAGEQEPPTPEPSEYFRYSFFKIIFNILFRSSFEKYRKTFEKLDPLNSTKFS